MQVANSVASGFPKGSDLSGVRVLDSSPYDVLRRIAGRHAVVVFSTTGCCMCMVAERLFIDLGVAPAMVDLDQLSAGPEIRTIICHLSGAAGLSRTPPPSAAVPAVFVGGKYVGGIEHLMASHINGTLVPLLKEAGAIWL